MAAAAEVEKTHTLTSSDGEQYVVEEAVAMQSQTMKNMIEDGCGGVIPLPNVHSKILALVIEYCRKHAETPDAAAADKDPKAAAAADADKDPKADLKAFDENFVKVDQTTLFDLILAANYLDIKGLLDLTCQAVANMIKDKTPEEIRNTFNIKNDFTKEEEDEIRRENQWAFE